MNFMSDRLNNKIYFHTFNMADDYNHEVLGMILEQAFQY